MSGRTRKFVHQTERQALENLNISRDIIYDSTPQVFYFLRKGEEPSFVSYLGYRTDGKYGRYVSKNPESYRKLAFEEASKKVLESFNGIKPFS